MASRADVLGIHKPARVVKAERLGCRFATYSSNACASTTNTVRKYAWYEHLLDQQRCRRLSRIFRRCTPFSVLIVPSGPSRKDNRLCRPQSCVTCCYPQFECALVRSLIRLRSVMDRRVRKRYRMSESEDDTATGGDVQLKITSSEAFAISESIVFQVLPSV